MKIEYLGPSESTVIHYGSVFCKLRQRDSVEVPEKIGNYYISTGNFAEVKQPIADRIEPEEESEKQDEVKPEKKRKKKSRTRGK